MPKNDEGTIYTNSNNLGIDYNKEGDIEGLLPGSNTRYLDLDAPENHEHVSGSGKWLVFDGTAITDSSSLYKDINQEILINFEKKLKYTNHFYIDGPDSDDMYTIICLYNRPGQSSGPKKHPIRYFFYFKWKAGLDNGEGNDPMSVDMDTENGTGQASAYRYIDNTFKKQYDSGNIFKKQVNLHFHIKKVADDKPPQFLIIFAAQNKMKKKPSGSLDMKRISIINPGSSTVDYSSNAVASTNQESGNIKGLSFRSHIGGGVDLSKFKSNKITFGKYNRDRTPSEVTTKKLPPFVVLTATTDEQDPRASILSTHNRGNLDDGGNIVYDLPVYGDSVGTLANKTMKNPKLSGEYQMLGGETGQDVYSGAYSLGTTNAEESILFSREIETDAIYVLEYTINAKSLDGNGLWTGTAVVSSTETNLRTTMNKPPSSHNWSINFDVSSEIFTINVTGSIFENIKWTGYIRLIKANNVKEIASIQFAEDSYVSIVQKNEPEFTVDTTTTGNFSLSSCYVSSDAIKSVILHQVSSGETGSCEITMVVESDGTVSLTFSEEGDSSQTFTSTGTITLGRMNLLVWTKSGTSVKFYLNTNSVESFTQTLNPSEGANEYNSWRIGADSSDNYAADAIIRNVAVYDVTLSSAEVTALIKAYGDPSEINLAEDDIDLVSTDILVFVKLADSRINGFIESSGNDNIGSITEVGALEFIVSKI